MSIYNDKIDVSFQLKTIIVYIVFGLLAFSPISSYIIMKILHLPMSLPEVFVILMLAFLPRDFKKHFSFNKKIFIKGFMILLLLLLIGILYGRYPTKELLGTARIYFDLLFYLSISTSFKGPNFNIIYYICLGSILGWIVSSINILISYFSNLESGNFVSLGNTLAIPLGLCAAVNMSKKNFVVFITLSLIVCLLSLVRRPLFILFISFLLLLLFNQISSKIKKQSLLLLFIISLLLPSIGTYLQDEYPIIYRRTFEKTIEFIGGDSNADDDFRKDNIKSFSLVDNIFPRGLVTRNTKDNPDGGLYIDYPFYEYFYTFGFLFLIIMIVLIYRLRFLYKCYKKYHDSYIFLLFYMGLIFVVLSFLEGTFLSSTYVVPFTGFLFGQFILYSKKMKYAKI